jgi:hypothetical protein
MAENKNRVKSFFDRGYTFPAVFGATSAAYLALIFLPYWSFLDDEVDQLIKDYTGLETTDPSTVAETKSVRWINGSGMDTNTAERQLIGTATLTVLGALLMGLMIRPSASNPSKAN